MIAPEFEKDVPRKKKEKTIKRVLNPHHRIQPMDEVPVDLGVDLERRMDTRTNAALLGITGQVGSGIDSGSDLNSLAPGDTDENDYEPITDDNLLTQNAYIHGVFQETAALKEDEATALQHQHKKRVVSNRLETDSIEHLPARTREEPTFTPLSRKKQLLRKLLKKED